MNTASLELCKELYELSGWGFSHTKNDFTEFLHDEAGLTRKGEAIANVKHCVPAYDLGYLLRKLPPYCEIANTRRFYEAIYHPGTFKAKAVADTPEDAGAKLAIELFKQDILTKGQFDD